VFFAFLVFAAQKCSYLKNRAAYGLRNGKSQKLHALQRKELQK
jgi:hypothetical protein